MQIHLRVVLKKCCQGVLGVCLLFSLTGGIASPAAQVTICAIQGTSFSSPYLNKIVRTQGIVTADLEQTYQRGFYLQSEDCDRKSFSSDGIFVYLAERLDLVQSGDLVEVKGLVQEYYGMTEIQVPAAEVQIRSHGNPLPKARELNPPFDPGSARYYLETQESMLVSLASGRVVGPTDADDRTWLTNADLEIVRVFHDDTAGTGEVICADDGGLYEIEPEAKTGDLVNSLLGVLDYRFGLYCLQLIAEPNLQPAAITRRISDQAPSGSGLFRLATFNLAELFDTIDDPSRDDQVLSPSEYERRIQKRALVISQELQHPEVLALQEVENETVLQDLLDRPEIQVRYDFVIEPGPDVRGLDVALVYRPDQATLLSAGSRQGCTGLQDGMEPDGNGDPQAPQNELTCDRDCDGLLDGNRLFSRPPLVVHLLGRLDGGQVRSASVAAFDFWLVVVHFKSKVGDSSITAYTLPRRLEQAGFVADLIEEIQMGGTHGQIIVLGDFNDHPDSQPLAILAESGLHSTAGMIARQERYTYIYRGISQTLDDILFSPNQSLAPAAVSSVHVNADYPYAYTSLNGSARRSSDHDPLVVDWVTVSPAAYFPLVRR